MMTPEKEMDAIVRSVCPDSGHWPYTRDSDLYIGYRPGPETATLASDRRVRMQVRYDIVICAQRSGLALEMEELRYKLYAALAKGGWKLDGDPGPETYDARQKRFFWPVTAVKSFALCVDGTPVDPAAMRKQAGDGGQA